MEGRVKLGRSLTRDLRPARPRGDHHGGPIGQDRQVSEDYLFRTVTDAQESSTFDSARRSNLVTSIHRPSLTPVRISVRAAWPSW